MAIKHKGPSKHAIIFDEPSLTEQEFKESCDAHKMLKRAANGQPILINHNIRYGEDDTNMTLTQHLINKQKIHEQLTELTESTEFTEEDMKHIPPSIKKNYKIRKKQAQTAPGKNDDQTTQKPAPEQSQNKTN